VSQCDGIVLGLMRAIFCPTATVYRSWDDLRLYCSKPRSPYLWLIECMYKLINWCVPTLRFRSAVYTIYHLHQYGSGIFVYRAVTYGCFGCQLSVLRLICPACMRTHSLNGCDPRRSNSTDQSPRRHSSRRRTTAPVHVSRTTVRHRFRRGRVCHAVGGPVLEHNRVETARCWGRP
jgi:hypothetical protein